MNTLKQLLIYSLFVAIICSCNSAGSVLHENQTQTKGKLFIIGGGKRSTAMIDRLIVEAGVDIKGYILILPMASAEEDTAIFYSSKQFADRGVDSIFSIHSDTSKKYSESTLQLIQNASLIYIAGGDQNRFMKAIEGTPIQELLHKAYNNGATIAGTSAGAAVMSQKMISGNEIKHPVYTGNYPTIEANNIEVAKGLGFIDKVIVDQHFIKRQRLNRLIAVCLENPENTCIGIDEATAIIVKGNNVEVVGDSQVIVLKHLKAETKVVNGLLGGKSLDLSIYLPGDSFII
jgi:cyanophycinase